MRSIDHTFGDTSIRNDFLVRDGGAECTFNVFDKWEGTQHVILSRDDVIAMAKAMGVTAHEMSTMQTR